MQLVPKTITGSENRSQLADSYQALVQFYYAFNNKNMDMMSSNWLQSYEAAMNNPVGGIQHGWDNIKKAYQKMFLSAANVYTEFCDFNLHETSEMFYAVGQGRGYFQLGADKVDLTIHTSHFFKLIDGSWKQVHYHGSIDDPKLLEKYQSAVFGE